MVYLLRFLRRLKLPTTLELVLGLVVLYGLSVLVFKAVGEPDLSHPFTALWWFAVTITTVGYGDFAPKTPEGEIFALLVLFAGVGTMAVVLGQSASAVVEKRNAKMNGLAKYKTVDHLVILGYEAGFTDELLKEILADDLWKDRKIILATNALEKNPYPSLGFVRGAITSDDVIRRTNLEEAAYVIVHGASEATTKEAAQLAAFHAPQDARIVAYVQTEEAKRFLKKVCPRVTAATPITSHVVAQELQDPGVVDLLAELLANGGQTIYRVDAPSASDVGAVREILQKKHRATLVAASYDGRLRANLPDNYPVYTGTGLFVIAEKRPVLT